MRRIAVVLALALAACTPTAEVAPPPAYAPDANGIALVGSPLRIDFGRAQAGTIAAVTRLEGRGPSATAACASGVTTVRWPSGLALQFERGAFLGWSGADGTSAGVACA